MYKQDGLKKNEVEQQLDNCFKDEMCVKNTTTANVAMNDENVKSAMNPEVPMYPQNYMDTVNPMQQMPSMPQMYPMVNMNTMNPNSMNMMFPMNHCMHHHNMDCMHHHYMDCMNPVHSGCGMEHTEMTCVPNPMMNYNSCICHAPCIPHEMAIHNVKLAHAYVPFQKKCSLFNCMESLKKGTVFPELYMPYMGRH